MAVEEGGSGEFACHEPTIPNLPPEQHSLSPANLQDWLPQDHLAYLVSNVVDQLDLSIIEWVYEADDQGQPPDHPPDAKVLLGGCCLGMFS
jgi:hypothetical protein